MRLNFHPKAVVKTSVISLLALGIIGSSALTANAKYRHKRYTYHSHRLLRHKRKGNRYGYWKKIYRHHRRYYVWHYYKKHRKRKPRIKKHRQKRHKKIAKSDTVQQPYEIDQLDPVSQMRYQTFRKVNQDRVWNGRLPLRETKSLHRLAQTRANQLAQDGFLSHYDQYGRLRYQQDAMASGIRLGAYSGENIAGAGFGLIQMDKNPHVYSNSSGIDMANMDEDEMVYHDADSNWGHRYNTLSSNYTKVGIAVAHMPGTNNYFVAENFSN